MAVVVVVRVVKIKNYWVFGQVIKLFVAYSDLNSYLMCLKNN